MLSLLLIVSANTGIRHAFVHKIAEKYADGFKCGSHCYFPAFSALPVFLKKTAAHGWYLTLYQSNPGFVPLVCLFIRSLLLLFLNCTPFSRWWQGIGETPHWLQGHKWIPQHTQGCAYQHTGICKLYFSMLKCYYPETYSNWVKSSFGFHQVTIETISSDESYEVQISTQQVI